MTVDREDASGLRKWRLPRNFSQLESGPVLDAIVLLGDHVAALKLDKRQGSITVQEHAQRYTCAKLQHRQPRTDVTPLVSPKSSTANGLSKDMK